MKIRFTRYFIITLLVHLLLLKQLFAFHEPVMTYLSIEQGLSNNSVRCIYKDHHGFMWFGTYDGLNRYDGYSFKVFRNKLDDSTSLPHNYIYTVHEDLQHNLWVGTGQGIGIYNNITSKFLPAYYSPFGTNQKRKITANVNVIRTDAGGNVYIGTNGWGLLLKEGKSDKAVQVSMKRGARHSTDYNIRAIAVDKKQGVWLFVEDEGLCFYDKTTKEIRVVSNELTSATSLEVDEGNQIWIGSNRGLYCYAPVSDSIVASYTEESGKLTSNNIVTLCFDNQQSLWIGTEGAGINILHLPTKKIDFLLPGARKNTITSESVYAIYVDQESRKWMGTLKGGINIIDPQRSRFQTVTHDPLNSNSLIYNFVSSFYEDAENNLWIGTDGGGLSFWNRNQNRFLNYRREASGSLSHNYVTSIQQDYTGSTWISTFGGGINKFNKAAGSFEYYKCINDATGRENKNVWLLYEDRKKDLWATTFSQGRLYRLNRQANRFEIFDQELTDLISITEDQSGTLWAGNSHLLIKIDRHNKKHVSYEIGKPVRAIYEDKKGDLWIGTEGGGLVLFNRQQGKIVLRYSTENGLCNNSVLNILEDKAGQLWLSTFNGLSRFNPATKTFKNYYQNDGLQSNQFLYNAALKLKSGELVFGGIKGFNIFYPESIRLRNNAPPVLLTNLRVNNVPVTDDDQYITSVKDDMIASLKIPYNEAIFSFDFAALEYSAPGKIAYAYYLEGWDKDWNYSGNLRTANYTNLKEGEYTLRIKSTNAEGVWNSKEVALTVIVLPPWYRSWWAYTIYLLLAGAIIYAYQQYRSRQAKLKYEIALAKVNAEKERAQLDRERSERETAQANYEKTQAQYLREKAERETERVINEREKEINEKRLSFFTNISHEFRTPLTLIINPIKDLLEKSDGEKKGELSELNIVYRNARRLLSLVDQLLLFRKAEAGADQLKVARLNLCSLCKDVFLAFVQQAKVSCITYEFVCANESLEIYADREKLEIVLYNLISNALKYTPQQGKIIFSVEEQEGYVEVKVADTGYGIPKEVGNKLFDKFYQVKEKSLPSMTGFGIGLYLVKHFVELHKGQVSYSSMHSQGTTFSIQLLKGKEHFSEQLISESNVEPTLLLNELIEQKKTVVENITVDEKSSELAELVSENLTLLVVDDDEQIRRYIAGIFADKFTVQEAASGEEGLKLVQQYVPDIVISDVNMQGMSGIDLCKTIKEDASFSHIPVILLTGSSSAETKLQGVEGGADDYITKPFEKQLLLARVTSLLKTRHQLQKYFYNEITLQQNPLKISAEYKEFLEKCIAVVERHLSDENFTVKTLTMELGMSHSSLYKKVKSISGQSVNAFIRFIRLRKAAEILINTNCNVNEAAFEVGFNDIKYFREQFSKLFGMNPSEYIKKYRKVFEKSYNLKKKV